MAAAAVAAIVGGWAVAQQPMLLPGLTVHEAAAGRATLVLGGGWREPLRIATLLAAAAVGSAGLVRLALRNQPEVEDLDGTPPVVREPCA